MKKFLIIAGIALVILGGGGYIGYNLLAPKILDYIVEKNFKVVQRELEEKKNNPEQAAEGNTDTSILDMFLGGLGKSENKDNSADNPPKEKKSISSFSQQELLAIYKKMSSSDKTRIITILKDNISVADIPKFAAMMGGNVSAEDKKFAENFYNNMPASAKNEIFGIILKYAV